LEFAPYSHQYKYFAAEIYEKKGLHKEASELKDKILKEAKTSKQGSMIRLSRGANASDMLIIDWDYDLITLKKNNSDGINDKNIKQIEKTLFKNKISVSLVKDVYDYYEKNNQYEQSLAYLLCMRNKKINLKILPWTIGEKFLAAGLPDSTFREFSKLKNSESEEFNFLFAKAGILSGKKEEIRIYLEKLNEYEDTLLLNSRKLKLNELLNKEIEFNAKKMIISRNNIINKLLLLNIKDEAYTLLDDNIKLGDIDSVLMYGELLMESGKPDAALKKIDIFLKEFKGNRKLYALMGEICYRVGSWNKGIRHYKQMMSFGKLRVGN